MSRVFIGLGSNEGDRLAHLDRAIKALAATRGGRLVQLASIRETAPVGGPPQGPYLNTVVEMETPLTPQRLLATLQAIERDLGRAPSTARWGPRPIDLDILLYEDRVVREPRLSIPHPLLHERDFVLEPLAELAPDLTHPVLKQTIRELRDRCTQ
jgi:2-amino-4-hydroxy-6-hydroxymethyldihydropteridine diphosphokinase